MISRTQRSKTEMAMPRVPVSKVRKRLAGLLAALMLVPAVCGSAALAASEIDDSPSPERLESLLATNRSLADAVRQNESFVMSEKTSAGLCEFAGKACAEQWNYVYGGKGQYMTPQLLNSVILSNLNDARSPYLRDGYIASTFEQAGRRATDCSGLVMAYMWWAGDTSDPIEALCPSIGCYNANAMLEAAVEKGPISSIPEIPGLLVHSNGHVGIYIGDGEVIEARGVRYGVTRTRLSERGFKYWSKSPWIDYETSGIYEIAGRYVFLDDGEDIGRERWVAKYVFGNALAGSTYVPICDSSATFGSALPAVYDADTSVSSGTAIALVDRLLAVVDTLEYDPQRGYFFEDHWYVIWVDENGMPEAHINDAAQNVPADTDSAPETETDPALRQDGSQTGGGNEGDFITFAPEPVAAAPDPVTALEDFTDRTQMEFPMEETADDAPSDAEGELDDEE